MANAILVDLARCVGCGACSSVCQEIHHFPQEESAILDEHNFTVLDHYETDDGEEIFVRRMCQHCQDPACVSVCLVGAFDKTSDGAVTWDTDKCIGCRYCMLACPFDVPKYEWRALSPKVRKCTMCHAERHISEDCAVDSRGFLIDDKGKRLRIDGHQVTDEHRDLIIALTTDMNGDRATACTVACPMEATSFGTRDELLAEAWSRITDEPDTYVKKVYGQHEVGGTSVFYVTSVPFEKLGFMTKLEYTPLPEKTWNVLKHIPDVVITAGVALGAVYWITNRRDEVRRFEEQHQQSQHTNEK